MNLLLLLSALKKSWEVIKKVLAFAWEYKYVLVIAILLFINTQLRNDIVSLNSDKVKLNNDIILLVQKQQQDLLEAEKKAQEQQIEILSKQKIVEEKYAKQVKDLSNSLADATSTNARLLNTLETAKSRVQTAPDTEVRDYSKTVTELLGKCETGKLYFAQRADEHANAEERAVGMYNTLVDDNKEIKE